MKKTLRWMPLLALAAVSCFQASSARAEDAMIEVNAEEIGLRTEINAGTYATPVVVMEQKRGTNAVPIIIPVGESTHLAFTPAVKLSFPQGPALSLGLLIGEMHCTPPAGSTTPSDGIPHAGVPSDTGDDCVLEGALLQFRPTFFGSTRYSVGIAHIEYSPQKHDGLFGPFFTNGQAFQFTLLETHPGSIFLGPNQKYLGGEFILPSGIGHTSAGLMIRVQGNEENEAWIPTVEWGLGF